MDFEQDDFNGLIINEHSIPNDLVDFECALKRIIAFSRANQKGITWLTLTIAKAELISLATAAGFVFHNCSALEITLVHKNRPQQFVPFTPTHSIGAGAIVMNDNNQLLVVKEVGMTGFKLPGGHVELAEKIETSIVREVFEETGITAEFISIQGFSCKHPYRFGKSNIYFVCKLQPLTTEIAIQDLDEIVEARWMSLEEFRADSRNSAYNTELISALWDRQGMYSATLEHNAGIFKKQEVFFSKG